MCVTFLPGCMHVQSRITVFHQFPPSFSGTSYAIVPLKDQEGSLEYQSYEQVLRQQLNTNGFREMPMEKADLAVFMSYGIDNGRQVVSSSPIYGQTGVASSSTSGNVQAYGNTATYSANTIYTPTYGVVGTDVQSHVEYSRFLKIDMVDRASFVEGKIKKLYEGQAISTGQSGVISAVLPTMIMQMFERFPGKNGSTRKSIRAVR